MPTHSEAICLKILSHSEPSGNGLASFTVKADKGRTNIVKKKIKINLFSSFVHLTNLKKKFS